MKGGEIEMKDAKNGIFPHKCGWPSCEFVVELDDEPNCFTHSPDSGSFEIGYSARRDAERGVVRF